MLVHVIDSQNRHHYHNARQTLKQLRRRALFDALLFSAMEGFCDGIPLAETSLDLEEAALDLVVLDQQLCFVAGLRLTPIAQAHLVKGFERPVFFGGVASLLAKSEHKALCVNDWEVSPIVYGSDTSDQVRYRAGTLLALAALHQSVRLDMGRFVGICDPDCLLRLKRVGWLLRPFSLESQSGQDDMFAFWCACGEDVFKHACELTGTQTPAVLHLPDLGRADKPLQIEGIGPLIELFTSSKSGGGDTVTKPILALLNRLVDEE
jgi:N-acyl-L-homoserine lactone synthetase